MAPRLFGRKPGRQPLPPPDLVRQPHVRDDDEYTGWLGQQEFLELGAGMKNPGVGTGNSHGGFNWRRVRFGGAELHR